MIPRPPGSTCTDTRFPCTTLSRSQSEMIRGGRRRALAALTDEPLEIEGIDPIPPITQWLPEMPVAPRYFGILIPKGVPDEVVATMDRVWEEEVATDRKSTRLNSSP